LSAIAVGAVEVWCDGVKRACGRWSRVGVVFRGIVGGSNVAGGVCDLVGWKRYGEVVY